MTNKEIAKTWYANIDSKNFDGIQSLMASNHQFHNPMAPAPSNDEEHIGMVQMMTTALEGQHHIDLMVEEGQHVAVRGHWSGKHVGEFNGVPATGNAVQFSFMDIFEIVDGKVVNEYLEMNPMAIMMQIGAMEAQGA